jgi:heme exporter protein D
MSLIADIAGKYGAYVWPAIGVTAVVWAWLIGDTLASARRWRRRVEELERDA